jgi:hypothetical protein
VSILKNEAPDLWEPISALRLSVIKPVFLAAH